MNRKRRKIRSKTEFHEYEVQESTRASSAGKRHKKFDRKTLQLCRQVLETLELVLTGETSDELLQSAFVQSVTPAPNASQLLVLVGVREPMDFVSKALLQSRLEARAPWLRSQIASSICRKKVPRLQILVT